jgi:hypothetical protein
MNRTYARYSGYKDRRIKGSNPGRKGQKKDLMSLKPVEKHPSA